MGDHTPGDSIRSQKDGLMNEVTIAVRRFETMTGVQIQSVHCYVPAPDPKLLNDAPKLKVDIILEL